MKRTLKMVPFAKVAIAAGLLITMAAFAYAGGGSQSSTSTSGASRNRTADGRTVITVALGDDPGTLDPALYGGILGLDATVTMIRESLYERDGVLIPQIAKGHTVDPDNLTYHVEIYDYVYDTAGNHLTADDVVFCYMRAKELGFNSTSFYDSVTKEGDYKVQIKMNNSMVGIFDQIAQAISLYTRKAFEDAKGEFGTKQPVFTGPYKVTEWISGTSMRLEKNEKYWQKPELRNVYAVQNVDIINFVIIKEAAQLSIALETGQVDMVANLNALEARRFAAGGASSQGFKVWEYTNRETQFMYLNQSANSIFGRDLNLRKAVMYSMNMQDLVDGATGGRAVIAKTFGNNMIVDYQKKWDTENYFNYDLNYAKQCLSSSNYNGQTVRIMVSGNELHGAMALILQDFLNKAGIKSQILTYENALFNTYKYDDAQWDVMFDQTSWSGPFPTQWRDKFDKRTFRDGKGGFISVSDDRFQSLLEGADNLATYSTQTVDAFHQYLKEQAYARGLFNQNSQSVTTDIVVEYMNHRIGSMFPAGCKFIWN
jgi:ABC-type transport system substrate-binding protein